MRGLLSRWLPTLIVIASGPSAYAQHGHNCRAMPGFVYAGVPFEGPRLLSVGVCGGYGYTEAQPAEGAGHHRVAGSVAVALRPVPFFTVGVSMDGRYDNHPRDEQGPDDGWVGEPRLALRVARELGSVLLGGEVTLRFPGATAPSIQIDATTVEARALAALEHGRWTVALNAGFRFDQSANAIGDVTRLRPGDRLALGASDSHAGLIAFGAAYRVEPIDVFAEVSGDILLGSDGGVAESPIRAALGARLELSQDLALSLVALTSLSSRPNLESDALIPVEPRVSVLAGLAWTLPLDAPAPQVVEPPPSVEEPPPPPPPVGGVAGRVLDESGEPIAGAGVRLAEVVPLATEVRDAPGPRVADARGGFSFDGLLPGRARLTAAADGYEDGSADVVIVVNEVRTVDFRLVRRVPPGQVRGLVRSFEGRVLAATITIEPLGLEATTDAEGLFEIDVPPGTYEVVIRSAGFADQRRPVTVEEQGVVIVNADLHRSR